MTNATKPPKDETAIQENKRIAAQNTAGINVLKEPKYLSASSAGIIRPGMPTAFRITKRVRDVDEDSWMTFFPKTVAWSSVSLTCLYVLTITLLGGVGRWVTYVIVCKIYSP